MVDFFSRANKVGKYRISFVFFLFVLLFAPPVVPKINVALFAALAAGILLCTRYRSEVKEAFRLSGLRAFSILFAVFLLYLAFVTVINIAFVEHVQWMHYVKLWYRFFLILPVTVVCSLYICVRSKELQYTLKDLCMCLVFATTAQFVIVLISFLIPPVRSLLIAVMYRNTGDAYLNIPWVLQRRGFGFSNSLLDSFGWGMGLIAALPLFLLSRKNQKILLLIPCMIFISLINVRTGLVMAGIGLLCSLPLLFREVVAKDKERRKRFFLFAALSVLLLAMFFLLVLWKNPVTFGWISDDVSSVVEVVAPDIETERMTDAQTTTGQTLFSSRFWNMPLGATLFFGSGHTIFGAEGYPNSDVGYINDLWMGGILGCLILYLSYFLFFKKAYRATQSRNEKLLVIFCALSMLVFQIKANAIMFNCGTVIVMMLLSYIVFYRRLQDERTEYPRKVAEQDGLISVIVPVYGVEEYLERCVDSILTQTYRNIEVILVDDGSPDKCPLLCDCYEKKDPRVRVIHKENGGLSDARNAGIEVAKGDYFSFVDSDDFLHPDFLLDLYSAAKNSGKQIVACGYYLYFSKGNKERMASGEEKILSPEEAVKDIFTQRNLVHTVAWNKLYRRDLFEKTAIRYPKDMIHEDVAVTYALCAASDGVAYIPYPLYYYTQRADSIIGERFQPKRLQLLDAVESIRPFVEQNRDLYGDSYEYFRFLNVLTLLNAMADHRYPDAQLYGQLVEKINEIVSVLRNGGYYSKKHRITVKLLNRGKGTFYYSRFLYRQLKNLKQRICD